MGTIPLAERRSAFMHYLSTHGHYHRFKEKLKPRIQRIVRDRYGSRGQALGKNNINNSSSIGINGSSNNLNNGSNGNGNGNGGSNGGGNGGGISGTNGPFEQMLSDLYVFLIKESNIILNKMYSNTMIDRDAVELEKYGKVNDEEESLSQLYNKLLLQANDNEANHHYKVVLLL